MKFNDNEIKSPGETTSKSSNKLIIRRFTICRGTNRERKLILGTFTWKFINFCKTYKYTLYFTSRLISFLQNMPFGSENIFRNY